MCIIHPILFILSELISFDCSASGPLDNTGFSTDSLILTRGNTGNSSGSGDGSVSGGYEGSDTVITNNAISQSLAGAENTSVAPSSSVTSGEFD